MSTYNDDHVWHWRSGDTARLAYTRQMCVVDEVNRPNRTCRVTVIASGHTICVGMADMIYDFEADMRNHANQRLHHH